MVRIENISERAKAYGFPGVTIDGNDMIEVMNTVDDAVTHAREGNGPTLIEMKTYRWKGHSKSDAKLYRTREEETEWKAKDPIKRFKEVLIEANVFTEEDAEAMKQQSKKDRRCSYVCRRRSNAD